MKKKLFAILISLWFSFGISVKCVIGIGQRGLKYSNGISWTRTCPNTDYCFEAVTTDITKVTKLFDYPWVS